MAEVPRRLAAHPADLGQGQIEVVRPLEVLLAVDLCPEGLVAERAAELLLHVAPLHVLDHVRARGGVAAHAALKDAGLAQHEQGLRTLGLGGACFFMASGRSEGSATIFAWKQGKTENVEMRGP